MKFSDFLFKSSETYFDLHIREQNRSKTKIFVPETYIENFVKRNNSK